ncbi:MAG: monothiol glutaredoxin, Grx4 family [Halobacteriovoraceae bacterium]|jgi:monothiol glutaredoxin|nr:monothiol glutaredoxin, Grx4 family [Halobacteriovoraceae bacterium]MBC99485.1 monothiol glutaredoxin, Grx4 family [Halobacteriovoraceae bacterium]|tara:strand:- start:225054 stop:225449 length:396 start_codon:yes stop_codon:yes gene_type:complete
MSNDNNPFNILGSEKVPVAGGTAVNEKDTSLPLEERIKGLLSSSDVFLFMKGTPDMPMCGFSANVISILNAMNAKYQTFNILEDMDIRQGLKEYSNWPTYPQLYVKGKLIGGNDIIMEMYEDGELGAVLNS